MIYHFALKSKFNYSFAKPNLFGKSFKQTFFKIIVK